MIVIGIGANLVHPEYGSPRRTCGAALSMLETRSIDIVKCSKWYRTAPVLAPDDTQSEQPWYINGAAAVDTGLGAHALLRELLEVEQTFGRVRSVANAPRTLDLDIILYNDQSFNDAGLNIPHPRMHERAFVLYPLKDLNPGWRHPENGLSIDDMISELPEDQSFEALEDADGAFGTEWQEN